MTLFVRHTSVSKLLDASLVKVAIGLDLLERHTFVVFAQHHGRNFVPDIGAILFL